MLLAGFYKPDRAYEQCSPIGSRQGSLDNIASPKRRILDVGHLALGSVLEQCLRERLPLARGKPDGVKEGRFVTTVWMRSCLYSPALVAFSGPLIR
jgi:hypothetical protein